MKVLIDTCSWINLANETYNIKYLDAISSRVFSGDIDILLPYIVRLEWDKHKTDKVLKSRLASLRTKIKHAREISELIEDTQDQESYLAIIDAVKKLDHQIETKAKKVIELIDNIFNAPNTINLDVEDELKLQACNWAIDKLPPFGDKNSMKDALIFLSTHKFLKSIEKEKCYFISENFTDFATRLEKDAFSVHLKKIADEVDFKFYSNVPLFCKEVLKIELGAKEPSYASIDILIDIMRETGICYKCGNPITTSWLRSFTRPDLTLHLICTNCKFDLDTLDFWDM